MKMEPLNNAHASVMSQDLSSVLLETLLILTSDDSSWGTAVMDYLMRSKLFYFLRHILLQVVGPTSRITDCILLFSWNLGVSETCLLTTVVNIGSLIQNIMNTGVCS